MCTWFWLRASWLVTVKKTACLMFRFTTSRTRPKSSTRGLTLSAQPLPPSHAPHPLSSRDLRKGHRDNPRSQLCDRSGTDRFSADPWSWGNAQRTPLHCRGTGAPWLHRPLPTTCWALWELRELACNGLEGLVRLE